MNIKNLLVNIFRCKQSSQPKIEMVSITKHELDDLRAWRHRIDWLLSKTAKDLNGYEYGIMKAKFHDSGELDHAYWCMSDGSDIDKAMQTFVIR